MKAEINNFTLTKYSSKPIAISFYYGYLISALNASVQRRKFKEFKRSIDINNRFEFVRLKCDKWEVDYNKLSNFELGKNTESKDQGSYYPQGVLELCFLINQLKLRKNDDQLAFLILGKSTAYFKLKEISKKEFSFVFNMIPLLILEENGSDLKMLFDSFTDEEDLGFLLNQIDITKKVRREISTNLIHFPYETH